MVAEIKDSNESARRLVTARTIDGIEPIVGADAIEVVVLGGWKVVVKKNEFKVGDPCLYFEIDSFLPDGCPAWQFLVDKSARMFNGVRGHKLRTVKLRGQISQGFVLSYDAFPEVVAAIRNTPMPDGLNESQQTAFKDLVYGMHEHEAGLSPQDMDFSALLGIVKWEAPLDASLAGLAEGLFPSFIRKTDQERCQNLKAAIFGYEDTMVKLDIEPSVLDEAALASGRVRVIDDVVYSVRPAQADPDARYEVSLKVDGSSMTAFRYGSEDGVCSRNLQLKVCPENAGNSFVAMYTSSGLQDALIKLGKNIAIQGELMGPAIQANREGLKDFQFFVFDVQLLDEGRYATSAERLAVLEELYALGVSSTKVKHVPVLYPSATLQELGLTNVEQLLAFAEGPSIAHPVREGLVFKRLDGKFSFKAISNQYLAKEKD